MTKKRRRFSSEFKFRVALEAAKGQRTISDLSSEYSVHPNQVSQWKRQLLEGGADLFNQNGNKEQREQQAVQTDLYEQIGRLKGVPILPPCPCARASCIWSPSSIGTVVMS